ncbi:MAG TPA: elongation factor G [Spirochaetia bacterium]|nr:elongation factor G [Spirochaetia bacterium]
MSVSTRSLRNVALAGHGGTGKTTLVDEMLAAGGAIPKAERVETGKTVSDFTEEEISRKISVHLSLSHVTWKDVKVNILDTPGSADFVGEVAAAFRVAECALLAVGADVGVQIETIKLWRRLTRSEMPRFVFVNKMEKERADFGRSVADLADKFKASFVPVVVPIGAGADFKGVVDLIDQKAWIDGKEAPVPDSAKAEVEAARQKLVESAAEGDDSLIEKFFAEGNLSPEEIRKGLASGMKARKLCPVLCGAAITGAGVPALLDFIAYAVPAPEGMAKAATPDGKEVERKIADSEPTTCFVFKTAMDQFTGKLSYFKVMSGKIAPDSDVQIAREGKKEKLTKVYTCLGKKLEETPELLAGDLGLLTKSASLRTNDTLHDPHAPTVYAPLELPNPVHALAISAKAKKDEDKMNQALLKITEEDLTFVVSYDKETKETVISGMGELHISMILDKIKEHQKIEVETKIPRVAYRETIQGKSEAEHTHKKQTGGHGQYAKVVLEVNPIPRGERFKFTNAIFGGAVSRGYIPGVEKGIAEAMEAGVLAGYPVVDVEARITDGKEHPVDSSELAFKLAAREAFRECMRNAKPVLLEPVCNLTVYVDEQYLGAVLSDLSGKRGKVSGQNPIGGGILEVKAQVPQAELMHYAIDLKALTASTGSFELEFDHYSPISGRIAEDVIKAAQAARAEEKDKE